MKKLQEAHVPYNTGWAGELKKGQVIRIIATTTVDFVCMRLDNLKERFDQARTKVYNMTIFVTAGHKLMGRDNQHMMTILYAGNRSVASDEQLDRRGRQHRDRTQAIQGGRAGLQVPGERHVGDVRKRKGEIRSARLELVEVVGAAGAGDDLNVDRRDRAAVDRGELTGEAGAGRRRGVAQHRFRRRRGRHLAGGRRMPARPGRTPDPRAYEHRHDGAQVCVP